MVVCVRVQNIQALVIAAAIRRLGWKGVAVLRAGWGKPFVDQLLSLKVGIVGEVVSREDILQMVWGYDIMPSTRTIDNFILAFRKTFEQDPKNPKHFHSIRGVGYKFES